MTINIETQQLQTKSFEAEVFRAYQQDQSALRNLCRTRQITGTSHQFPKYGTLSAVERIVGTPLVTENQSAGKVEVSITRYNVSTYSDIFLQNEVNFDDKMEAAYAVAAAAVRKTDQIIINALEAQRTATYTNVVSKDIGGADTNLNVAKFAEIAKLYDKGNIKRSDRNLIIHANNYHKFTQESNVASSDYNNFKVLASGSLPSYYGINLKVLGDIDNEDGLKLASTIRYCYAVQKEALGFVVNKDMSIEKNYVPTMGADLITCFFSCGSKVIEEKGIVEVRCKE